ncbi:MAG: ABC transporter permease, partial [Mesorhizobium sp.]
TVMILVTVGIPLIGGILMQSLTKLRRRGEPKEEAK